MFDVPTNLQYVFLKCPYDCWGDLRTGEIFSKIVALKLEGYKSVWPYGILPVDTYDFVANHLLICEENRGQLEVLAGVKEVTLERCKIHQLPFPGMSLLLASSSDTREYQTALAEIIQRSEAKCVQLGYVASWTMASSVKDRPGLGDWLKKEIAALLVLYSQDQGIAEHVCCAAPKFKTDRFFRWVGYSPIQESLVKQASLMDEPVQMFHLVKFSDEILALTKSRRALWDERILVGTDIPRDDSKSTTALKMSLAFMKKPRLSVRD